MTIAALREPSRIEREVDFTCGLIRAIHPDLSACRDTLVLKMYVDDTEDGDRVLGGVGGYIAHEGMWEAFERQWRALLDREGVREFHAADFFGGYGEFSGWRPGSKKHKRYARRLAAIVEGSVTLGVSRSVDLRAFDEIVGGSSPILERTPMGRMTYRMWCTWLCLDWITRRAPHRPKNEPIALFLDDGNAMEEVCHYLRWAKKRHVPWMEPYATITTAPSVDFSGLQAADFLAHQSQRHLAPAMKSGVPRPAGPYLRRLGSGGMLQIDYMDRVHLQRFVQKIEALLVAGHPLAVADISGVPEPRRALPLWRRVLPKWARRLVFRFLRWAAR